MLKVSPKKLKNSIKMSNEISMPETMLATYRENKQWNGG